jgi:SRSO17 transposase
MGVLGMDLASTLDCQARFSAYVEGLASVIGHADREGPLRDYCMGLLLPGERKSVEPMAAITAPARTAAQHQSLLHFVGESGWVDNDLLTKVREMVLPAIERGGAIEAWIVDDTGLPKKGKHSVGVARQYCGQVGKQENCQVAVSLSIANHHASLPIAYRLYLPREWAEDAARRRKVRVPDEIEFKTKHQIALEQIRAARKAGVPVGVVVIDSGYGASTELRTGISLLALTYVAGILPQTRSGQSSRSGQKRLVATRPVRRSPNGFLLKSWQPGYRSLLGKKSPGGKAQQIGCAQGLRVSGSPQPPTPGNLAQINRMSGC